MDLNLTTPGHDGECLNGNDHPWGTYTYDFLVMEYTGTEPAWVQADAIDWQFLKRYKDGYHLWVPANLPSPHGDEPGHKVWTDVPENGDAGLRGFYCLESDWGAQEAQVSRGNDAQIVIVDPELEERSNTSGPAAVETLGADYGTADADSDGELDGLPLYTYQDSDPAGTWRGIFMANDNGGIHSPNWRTHEPVRMLTANERLPRYKFWLLLDPGHGKFWRRDSYDDLLGRCTEVGYRGGEHPADVPWQDAEYLEANAVLGYATALPIDAHGMLIKGRSVSRTDEWDIGLYDDNQSIGGFEAVEDEAPRYYRSLDMRVRWAKQQQIEHWGNGYVPCLFVSLHTDKSSLPWERGAFRMLSTNQGKLTESGSLGDDIVSELGLWVGATDDPQEAKLQVLDMVSKILTEDSDWYGEEYEPGFQEFEPADATKRRRMPAVLVEVGQHNHSEDRAALQGPGAPEVAIQAVYDGVADWIRQNGGWSTPIGD